MAGCALAGPLHTPLAAGTKLGARQPAQGSAACRWLAGVANPRQPSCGTVVHLCRTADSGARLTGWWRQTGWTQSRRRRYSSPASAAAAAPPAGLMGKDENDQHSNPVTCFLLHQSMLQCGQEPVAQSLAPVHWSGTCAHLHSAARGPAKTWARSSVCNQVSAIRSVRLDSACTTHWSLH